jgi:hypothetical protein
MQGVTMDLGWIAREYDILIRYDKAHHCCVLVRPIDDSHVLVLHPYRDSRLIIRVLLMSANVGFCCGSGMVAPSLDNAIASFTCSKFLESLLLSVSTSSIFIGTQT